MGILSMIGIISSRNNSQRINCFDSISGASDDSGFKRWCWQNHTVPIWTGSKAADLVTGAIVIDTECRTDQLSNYVEKLQFYIDPEAEQDTYCTGKDGNMRCEIRTDPWLVDHPAGTEEWFGFSYYFPSDYVIDSASEWGFWQVHNGVQSLNQLALQVLRANQYSGNPAGQISISNNAAGTRTQLVVDSNPYIPAAGQRIDIVIHVIWDEDTSGLFKIWFDGVVVHNAVESTVYAANPVGGNAKWGIYKWPWATQANIDASAAAGVTYMRTFMGPLRVVTRFSSDPDYGQDAYNLVDPSKD